MNRLILSFFGLGLLASAAVAEPFSTSPEVYLRRNGLSQPSYSTTEHRGPTYSTQHYYGNTYTTLNFHGPSYVTINDYGDAKITIRKESGSGEPPLRPTGQHSFSGALYEFPYQYSPSGRIGPRRTYEE